MERVLIVGAGVLGFLAVALGAFGAHGLQRWLEGAEDAARRFEWWKTGGLLLLAGWAGVVAAALRMR